MIIRVYYPFCEDLGRYTWSFSILKRHHLLLIEYHCIFKMVTLVKRFLHSSYPSCFGTLSYIHCDRYGKRYSRQDKRYLEVFCLVFHFYPSVHKQNTSAYEAPTVLNNLETGTFNPPILCPHQLFEIELNSNFEVHIKFHR